MSCVTDGIQDVYLATGQDNDETRVIGLEPYLAPPPAGGGHPSLVDCIIKLVQKVYADNPDKVTPGTFNPEFSRGVALFVASSLKGAEMTQVTSSKHLIEMLKLHQVKNALARMHPVACCLNAHARMHPHELLCLHAERRAREHIRCPRIHSCGICRRSGATLSNQEIWLQGRRCQRDGPASKYSDGIRHLAADEDR